MPKRVAIKNFLDNLTSYLRHDSTAIRQWTLPDRSGEVVVITDSPAEGDVIQYKDGKWQKRTLQQFVDDIKPLLLNP